MGQRAGTRRPLNVNTAGAYEDQMALAREGVQVGQGGQGAAPASVADTDQVASITAHVHTQACP